MRSKRRDPRRRAIIGSPLALAVPETQNLQTGQRIVHLQQKVQEAQNRSSFEDERAQFIENEIRTLKIQCEILERCTSIIHSRLEKMYDVFQAGQHATNGAEIRLCPPDFI